jgi:hypothetical protein
MINVCIYCGKNKTMALEECPSCCRSPNSHVDVIHSIILCFSETEPYLNFLCLEEIEEMREKIVNGDSIDIKIDVFNKAEEAYNAVKSNNGPKAIQYFSNISLPIIAVVVLTMLATIFI